MPRRRPEAGSLGTMSTTIEWASAAHTAMWTIGRLEEAPDRQTLEDEPEGTIGLVLDGGGGGGYVIYGQPEEIIRALEKAIKTVGGS